MARQAQEQARFCYFSLACSQASLVGKILDCVHVKLADHTHHVPKTMIMTDVNAPCRICFQLDYGSCQSARKFKDVLKKWLNKIWEISWYFQIVAQGLKIVPVTSFAI